MKNKKSDYLSMTFILILIITILFGVIYFVWLKNFKVFAGNLGDYAICRQSNIENANLKLKINNDVISERHGNKCRTEYVKVPKGEEFSTIAKKMAGCWDMYLEGKMDLFDTDSNNWCAFCSVLSFEDKKQLNGLTDYLAKNKVPNQGGKTYFQYLTRTVVTDDVLAVLRNSQIDDENIMKMDTSKPLAVIFTTNKNAYPGSLTGFSSVRNAAIGTVAGAVGFAGAKIIVGAGLCTGFITCSAGALLIAGGIGTLAYMIGSNYGTDRDTKILLWPYTNEDLSKLKCTVLEGKDRLDIKKF